MYEWASRLDADAALKRAVDAVVCALCYIAPPLTGCLLRWMGIAPELQLASAASLTDDLKGSTR